MRTRSKKEEGNLDVVGLADLVVGGGGADAEHVVELGLLRHDRRRRRCCSLPQEHYPPAPRTTRRRRSWDRMKQREHGRGSGKCRSGDRSGRGEGEKAHHSFIPQWRGARAEGGHLSSEDAQAQRQRWAAMLVMREGGRW